MKNYTLIVVKSTVPPGTTEEIARSIKKFSAEDFDVASNPEFLREGEAINDFLIPDRIIIGVNSSRAADQLRSLYNCLERAGRPIMVTDIRSCELIKYASNAMLALRISFVNELSGLCDALGADIKQVAKGVGLDTRIGPRFLHAGIGYGGSCFPKDVKALISILEEHKCKADIMSAVHAVNERQKHSAVSKLKAIMPLAGKKVAVWGLSFKPKTDDMREAPSIVVVNDLLHEGAEVVAFDPVAEDNAKKLLKITFAKNPYDALSQANALIIATEWDEFRQPDWKRVKALMKDPIIIDGRNIYEPSELKKLGFKYVGVGR